MRNTLLVDDGISSNDLPALLIMPFSLSPSLRVRHSSLTESAVVEGFESQNWLSEYLERCATECSLQLREAAGIGNCCGSWEHLV